MHRIVLLLLLNWLPTLLLGQDLSGKWKGIFTPNQDQDGQVYYYELEIKEFPNHSLSVITFTKISNNFSAKAIANGMHSESTQLVSVVETKFENMQLLGNYQACLMTNYLTYSNNGGREILKGTYISSNSKLGKDCGSGSVYLKKEVPFVKIIPNNNQSQNKKTTIPNSKIAPKQNKLTVDKNNIAKSIPATKNIIIPNSNKTILGTPQKIAKEADSTLNEQHIVKTTKENASPSNEVENTKLANRTPILPYVLVGRENKLVNKITVNVSHISLDLYDNGTIDNDTIMVYDNKKQILYNQRLSYKPIHFELDFTKEMTEHEIIIVAQNLGTVPPNTALIILKNGITRKEYFITSTLQTNAMIIINYIPPN